MAMVLQANRVSNSNNSSNSDAMDSYQTQLHHHRQSPPISSPTGPRSPSPSPNPSTHQEDNFRRVILDKVEAGKQHPDPKYCRHILEDMMKMLKHLTADVNNYNLAFRETRPPFYMQEFQRLTDRIDILTKARDTLTEYLHEVEDQIVDNSLPYSSSFNDVSSMSGGGQQQYSPTMPNSSASSLGRSSPPEKSHPHTSSISSIHSGSKEIFLNDHLVEQTHFYPSSPPMTTITNLIQNHQQRPRSPSMTPSNFIRVHFPNKHTTALAPRNDETLEVALESRASRHSVTNLRAYTPVYMISRQPCPWDIILDRVLETEIELEEKTKLDHSFEDVPTPRFPLLSGIRCVFCHHRIREAHKRCVSCGNNYHKHCYSKAPVCSHPLLQHIKHLGPDRNVAQGRIKEQWRSLPRFPVSRPSITTNHHVVGPRKDNGQDSHAPARASTTNPFPNAVQSTIVISSSLSSNSLFQPVSTITSSSLPASTSTFLHIPQLMLPTNGSTLNQLDIRRPSIVKPSSESGIDSKKLPNKYISEWEIRPEDVLNRGRMAGRGSYGTVYKAEVRLHGSVAFKELNFAKPNEEQLQAFRNEVIALKKITHQNTLNFYGYIQFPRFAIITQWCEGSTLYKHIHILDRHWKITQLIDIARQICQGMSYLHDRGIIHRDLKSSNVFLDVCAEHDDVGASWRVKIGDFGLAAFKTVLAEGINPQCQPTGSVLWMAPEVIQQKDPNCYSTSSDVYSYGCVLFEMFSEKLPHTPISNKEQIMWLVGKGRLKLKVEQCRDDTPTPITDLIRQCTEFDREKRPNFAPEIDETLSKFECVLPRLQRSQSEPCLIRTHQDDLLGLSIHFGVPKTPVSIHRRFNAEVS